LAMLAQHAAFGGFTRSRGACKAFHSSRVRASTADLVLGTGTEHADAVRVFGVDHSLSQRHVAESVFTQRPHTLVMETSIDASAEASLGTRVEYDEGILPFARQAGLLGHLTRVAWQLRQEQPLDLARSATWNQLCESLPTEPLVYLAALVANVPIVYGDRTKAVTYRRLFANSTLVDLDFAFGVNCAANYDKTLSRLGASSATGGALDAELQIDHFHLYVIEERNRLLRHSFASAALACRDSEGEVPAGVMAVVGADHLEGIERDWLLDLQDNLLSEPDLQLLLEAPPSAPLDPELLGAKLGLLARTLELRCAREVTQHALQVLGLAELQAHGGSGWVAFEGVLETYGTCRMMLATVPEAQLGAIVSGHACDMAAVLQPLRVLRPVEGGRGYDEEALKHLRTLNFELE